MARTHKRPGNTPVEQQERKANEADKARPVTPSISGPGAADFLTSSGGFDVPESGTKGMAQTRDPGAVAERKRSFAPRLGPDRENPDSIPGVRDPAESMTGSQTGTIGGGGFEAHNPSPIRATEERARSKQDRIRKRR